ncbi:uncharacterized protein [Triticum aestivum]|uniref:uncharacterized protein n=1 Tax=Triticum aestivum TaxID=4565 RepID=UPI001D006421|nr:uncharacterized protein LOC123076323 [Triticum aestivum]
MASTVSSVAFASVGSARLPTWHSASTFRFLNLTSAVGITMPARSMRARSFLRKRSLSSSATRKTLSTKACRCGPSSMRTSTSSCANRRRPAWASDRRMPVRSRSNDGSRSSAAHRSASSSSLSPAPLRRREDPPEKYTLTSGLTLCRLRLIISMAPVHARVCGASMSPVAAGFFDGTKRAHESQMVKGGHLGVPVAYWCHSDWSWASASSLKRSMIWAKGDITIAWAN